MGVSIEELKRLVSESETQRSVKVKSKTYKITKVAIISIVIFLAVIGVLGSTHWGMFINFAMGDFTSFLDAYGGMFMMLIGSIGIGGAAKNGITALAEYKKALQGIAPEKTSSDTSGEDLVRSGA